MAAIDKTYTRSWEEYQSLVNLDVMKYIDWCYKHHIDINGLIPIGLAIDATGKELY